MENQQLYDLSTRLSTVLDHARDLLELHATRYRFFIDNSPRGFDCTYARQTAKLFEREEGVDAVLTKLRDHRAVISKFIEELENEHP